MHPKKRFVPAKYKLKVLLKLHSFRGIVQHNMGKIKFLQLNLQHAKQAQHEINRWIDRQKDKDYVVLVQEPYLYLSLIHI